MTEIQRTDPHLPIVPWRDRDVRRVVDRRRQDGAAVAFVVVGEVRATADGAPLAPSGPST